jgi:hypothetical protein
VVRAFAQLCFIARFIYKICHEATLKSQKIQKLYGNLTVNNTSFRLRSKKTKKLIFRNYFGSEKVSFGGVFLEAKTLQRRL